MGLFCLGAVIVPERRPERHLIKPPWDKEHGYTPQIAVDLAQWSNVDYRIQGDCWMVELHKTGKVESDPAMGSLELTFPMLNEML